MTKFILPLSLLAVALPSAASAQDAGSAADLSGPRAELFVGHDRVRGDFGGTRGEEANESGALFGGSVGYDFAIGNNLSAGIDAEIADTTTDGLVRSPAGATLGEVSFGSEVYAGGRLTFAVSPSFAVVGKLGYSYLVTEYETATLAGVDSDDLRGVRGALGVQFSTDDDQRTYYGVEGRVTRFNDGVNRRGIVLFAGVRF